MGMQDRPSIVQQIHARSGQLDQHSLGRRSKRVESPRRNICVTLDILHVSYIVNCTCGEKISPSVLPEINIRFFYRCEELIFASVFSRQMAWTSKRLGNDLNRVARTVLR